MKYLILEHSNDPKLCSLDSLENVSDSYELCYGISRSTDFPSNAAFRMSPENKRAIKLADALDNGDFLMVVSSNLKDYLVSENVPDVEYLPVTIFDHKKRIASKEYFIVNQIGTQDCIDCNRSKIKWNIINPDQISDVNQLVLDEKKIPPDALLFRAKHLPQAIIIRADLAEKITNFGFTGIEFLELSEYTF